jgi:hypothetical protein
MLVSGGILEIMLAVDLIFFCVLVENNFVQCRIPFMKKGLRGVMDGAVAFCHHSDVGHFFGRGRD